jgi:Domain of unknown function (DUF5658)
MSLKIYCWAGLSLYVLLSVADLMLTRALLQTNGEAYESNPAAAACLELHGWSGLALYKTGGVLIFVGSIYLLARRRPAVGAVVVTIGCGVLLFVTTYTHSLILDSKQEIANRDAAWPKPGDKRANANSGLPLLDRCWFAAR